MQIIGYYIHRSETNKKKQIFSYLKVTRRLIPVFPIIDWASGDHEQPHLQLTRTEIIVYIQQYC